MLHSFAKMFSRTFYNFKTASTGSTILKHGLSSSSIFSNFNFTFRITICVFNSNTIKIGNGKVFLI